MAVSCLLFCLRLLTVQGLHTLPERGRSGTAWQALLKASSRVGNSTANTWDAPQDHFSTSDESTFQQRYYYDDTYWDGKGPVFFEIGGEGTLNGSPGGWISSLGQEYNALLVALEHRFYGESIPNGNSETSNLYLLTVEQALADLNTFTAWFTEEFNTGDAPWVVFGGSYPGALSAWYRTTYPGASIGSLSSSGVVNCIIDYKEFDMQVSAAVGNDCSNQIKRINKAFENAISTEDGWLKSLDQFYCEKDMWKRDFLYMIADSWSMVDQYSSKSQLCEAILAVGPDASDDVLTATFSNFSNSFWGTDFCSMGFYNTEALADPARWDVNSRSWRWQTCYQVSYFNTAPPTGSLRAKSVDLMYHLEQCQAIFGIDMYPSSTAMNARYGGEFPHAHNVFYSDFSDDPWNRASVDFPPSSDQPFFYTMCNDCGHCMDFGTPSPNDPVELQQSRAEFVKYMDLWLAEYYNSELGLGKAEL